MKEEVPALLSESSLPLSTDAARIINIAGGSDDMKLCLKSYSRILNEGEGSCFYRAIFQASFDTKDEHLYLRFIVVEHVVKNFKILKNKLAELNFDGQSKYKTPEKYRRYHMSPKEFATPFEIFIFVQIFNIPVQLFACKSKVEAHNNKLIMQFSPDSFGNDDDCINLIFIEPCHDGHFEFAKNIGSNNFLNNISQNFFYENCSMKNDCKSNQITKNKKIPNKLDVSNDTPSNTNIFKNNSRKIVLKITPLLFSQQLVLLIIIFRLRKAAWLFLALH